MVAICDELGYVDEQIVRACANEAERLFATPTAPSLPVCGNQIKCAEWRLTSTMTRAICCVDVAPVGFAVANGVMVSGARSASCSATVVLH